MVAKKNDPEHADGGADEVQKATDEAEAKGYIGYVPDPHPNSAYSLQSGPDSPSLVSEADKRAEVPEAPKEAGHGNA